MFIPWHKDLFCLLKWMKVLTKAQFCEIAVSEKAAHHEMIHPDFSDGINTPSVLTWQEIVTIMRATNKALLWKEVVIDLIVILYAILNLTRMKTRLWAIDVQSLYTCTHCIKGPRSCHFNNSHLFKQFYGVFVNWNFFRKNIFCSPKNRIVVKQRYNPLNSL